MALMHTSSFLLRTPTLVKSSARRGTQSGRNSHSLKDFISLNFFSLQIYNG